MVIVSLSYKSCYYDLSSVFVVLFFPSIYAAMYMYLATIHVSFLTGEQENILQ